MESRGHKPVLSGTRYICANCGDFLLDVRTPARVRALKDVDRVKRAAVERRCLHDPKLAKRLMEEDPREVVSTYKLADKFNDFLMNPEARPDLQKPEAQQFLNSLQTNGFVNDKTDELLPWLTREWKKGRVKLQRGPQYNNVLFDAGPEYAYDVQDPDPYGEPVTETYHRLSPDTLGHWADWYRSDHPSRKGVDIMQLKSPELHQTIKDWDADMREKAKQQAQVRGDVEHTYPDGWTVQNINTEKALKDEGNAMGHCVGGYWGSVNKGNTIIHSLRDPHNEPHATWEITPRWFEGPEGDLKSRGEVQRAHDDGFRWAYDYKPTAKRGEVVQIQGKANERPLPEYQQRIKDYFENKFPNEEDRPQWGDQYYEDLDEITDGQVYGYHQGDYGLNYPNVTYDWNALIDNAEYFGQNIDDLVQAAVDAGELHHLSIEAENWIALKRDEHKKYFDATKWSEARQEWEEEYDSSDPPPYEFDYMEEHENGEEEFDEAAYYEAQDEWEKRKNRALEESESEIEEEAWDHTDMAEFCYQLESELSAARYRQKHMSATRLAHPRFITGEPCYCTFTKHLEELPQSHNWYVSAIMVCEACGDPLEHGKCKRCDWGQWSNAMGTENPSDPTKEVKPAIQA